MFSNGGIAKENNVCPSPFEIAKSPNLIISIPINMSASPPIAQTEPLTPFIDTLFGNNKLNNAITVKIEKAVDRAKLITLSKGDDEVTRIEVENKSGTILPFTGGMGTTVIYIVGALLVLISGVVLITKKRTDLK